jgi:hypothetical protein
VVCTALRYFAPSAAPLNKHGATLRREQQTALEQPACVHAAMDLLKIALKLHPYLRAELVGDALEARPPRSNRPCLLCVRTLELTASVLSARSS